MTFKEFLRDNIVLLDGGMGTLLQERGLEAGEAPEMWNISHPAEIVKKKIIGLAGLRLHRFRVYGSCRAKKEGFIFRPVML